MGTDPRDADGDCRVGAFARDSEAGRGASDRGGECAGSARGAVGISDEHTGTGGLCRQRRTYGKSAGSVDTETASVDTCVKSVRVVVADDTWADFRVESSIEL